MADTLYDTDFVIWSERQAAALRAVARGELPNDIDWPNLIEEVEDLGRSWVSAVESLLARAMEHLLKVAAWPEAPNGDHWRREVAAFLNGARRRWQPSMRQRIDLSELYTDALGVVQTRTITGQPPDPLPHVCPWTLDELLQLGDGKRADVDQLLARLAPARDPSDAP